VGIYEGAQYNFIGGDTPEERNVISGNESGDDGDGVIINGFGTDHNTVSGNYIGTDISGTAPISNSGHGVSICCGASNNIVGGDTAGERNVISASSPGVRISGSGTNHNVVIGNYIGTNASGTAAIPNVSGVSIEEGALSTLPPYNAPPTPGRRLSLVHI
jgi:titin